MKTTRIDQYICIDTDQIIIDEMNDIIDNDSAYPNKEDDKYWKRLRKAAKIVKDAYTI
jgi:hypothetical protein